MTATGHAIIGTVIAMKLQNPALAVPIAFASHIAADMIPHWDTATNSEKKSKKLTLIESFFDVILGFAVSYTIIFLFSPQTSIVYAFSIVIASQLLDWATIPYYFLNIKFPPFKWIYDFQKLFDNTKDKPMGIIYQAAAVIVFVLAASFIKP